MQAGLIVSRAVVIVFVRELQSSSLLLEMMFFV